MYIAIGSRFQIKQVLPKPASFADHFHRNEILNAVSAELNGGTKTGLAHCQRDSVLYFSQLDLALTGRKLAGTVR